MAKKIKHNMMTWSWAQVRSRVLNECADSRASRKPLILLFSSIFLYAIRVRNQESAILFFIENALFFFGFLYLRNETKRQMILPLAFLLLNFFITAPITFINFSDILYSITKNIIFIKCIICCLIIINSDIKKIIDYGIILMMAVVLVQIFRYQSGDFSSAGDGFTGGITDRNYLALMDSFIILSLVIVSKKIKLKKTENILLKVLNIIIFLIVIASGSRSGILVMILSILILDRYLILYTGLALIIAFIFTDAFDFMYARVIEIQEKPEGEYIRVAQLIAVLQCYFDYPIGIITGFGLEASGHMEWFYDSYRKLGLVEYSSGIHNTIIDLFFSFGLSFVFIAYKIFRKIKLILISLLILCTLFINCVTFLPFYFLVASSFIYCGDGLVARRRVNEI